MNFKTNKIQPVFPIIKIILALAVFYLIAILISPAKIYTAIFYLRIFIPLAVIGSIYMIVTAKNANIQFDEKSLTLNLGFGRNKSTSVEYSDIYKCQIHQNTLEKIFNVYTVQITTSSAEAQLQKKISFVNQYMIFSKDTALEISKIIEQKIKG